MPCSLKDDQQDSIMWSILFYVLALGKLQGSIHLIHKLVSMPGGSCRSPHLSADPSDQASSRIGDKLASC